MALYQISEKTNLLSKTILDAAFRVHSELGPGLLESVYEACLAQVLLKGGIKVERQKVLPVRFEDMLIETGFRLDLLVENEIIVEIKAHEKILPVHEAQLFTYLKLSQKPLGMILNFNARHLKDGIKRIAMAQNYSEDFV